MSIGAHSGPGQLQATPSDRRGLALAVIAGAQLMLTLDSTIMNIALPSIEVDFHVAAANLAWIVTAYALSFGGLLLLGGRAGDVFGRRRMFRTGMTIFILASLLGGVAPNVLTLILARLLQGVGAAIAAPTAMALIATTFPEGRDRVRAMGIFSAMSPLGSTAGLLLGGLLTEFANWRWVLFVNLPIGVVVLLGTRILPKGERGTGRLDIPGAATATLGVTSLVYAITRGQTDGWTDGTTLACFGAAVVLLALFLFAQVRSAHPMLPLRVLRDRNRAGAYVTMLFVGTGMFATYFFLTLYMQQLVGISALQAGFSYLPFALSVGASAAFVAPRLLAKLPPRGVTGIGLVLAVGGMVSFSRLTPDSPYAAHLMPSMIATGLGLGLCFMPMSLGAVRGVDRQDVGIASGLLNASVQVGGALGLSALSTVAASVTAAELPDAGRTLVAARSSGDTALARTATDALINGYTTVFVIGAVLYVVALVVVLSTVTVQRG